MRNLTLQVERIAEEREVQRETFQLSNSVREKPREASKLIGVRFSSLNLRISVKGLWSGTKVYVPRVKSGGEFSEVALSGLFACKTFAAVNYEFLILK